MSFRKIHVKVTPELLNDIINDVKQKFLFSDAPAYQKKLLKKIHPNFHIVRKPKWNIYGQAWLVSHIAKKDIAKRHLKLNVNKHPSITIDGDIYFCILQINRGCFSFITRRGLRYLVAHELAHLLQIVIDEEVDGLYSYSTSEDHNKKWFNIVRRMGGTGSEYIPPEEIWV